MILVILGQDQSLFIYSDDVCFHFLSSLLPPSPFRLTIPHVHVHHIFLQQTRSLWKTRLLCPSAPPHTVDLRFWFSSDGLSLFSLHQRRNCLGAVLPFLPRLDGGSGDIRKVSSAGIELANGFVVIQEDREKVKTSTDTQHVGRIRKGNTSRVTQQPYACRGDGIRHQAPWQCNSCSRNILNGW